MIKEIYCCKICSREILRRLIVYSQQSVTTCYYLKEDRVVELRFSSCFDMTKNQVIQLFFFAQAASSWSTHVNLKTSLRFITKFNFTY